jgi:NAD(P)-dependent dehydrogenase (short-subunit alcohol dehydrogenase family)
MNSQLKRIAVLTGANGQIGKYYLDFLINKGFFVYAIDKVIDRSSKSASCETISLDITNELRVHEFYSKLKDVDLLINNAGIGVFTRFEDRTAQEFRDVMEVNLLGTFLMSQGVVKIMKKRLRGKIINIASIYGTRSSDERIYGESNRKNSEVYSATKAGIISLTKYMSAHFGRYNIQTNCISPGGIFNNQNDFFVKQYIYKTPANRMGCPEDMLSTLDYLISDDSSYVNGQNIVVDGGFTSW